ncbi:hypothetical protein Tco_1191274 [Tanacetum coccineum]
MSPTGYHNKLDQLPVKLDFPLKARKESSSRKVEITVPEGVKLEKKWRRLDSSRMGCTLKHIKETKNFLRVNLLQAITMTSILLPSYDSFSRRLSSFLLEGNGIDWWRGWGRVIASRYDRCVRVKIYGMRCVREGSNVGNGGADGE